MKALRLVPAACVAPALAWAHAGQPVQPHDVWSAWEFDPGVVILLGVAALLYARGSRRETLFSTRRRAFFWTGWFALVVALISPLHPLGEALFSAHMVQHEVLMIVAAPLLILSRPLVTFLWGMPFEWRRVAGRWSKAEPVQRGWVFLTDPLTAWWLHAAAIWIWHAPVMFDLTLRSEAAHTAQHLSFFLSALLFWWALLYAHGRKSYGAGVLYVFTTAVHTSILGALLTFTPHIWYAAYGATAPSWGLTPLEDQQIGGLIMWVPASLVYLAAGLALFAAWLRESDLRVERASGAKQL
ncbi:MAG: cytochrome c oxidase assembly protein [Acidobacteriaceae bacterium]|nr:cytochrome c oxidase assembly protein [Acidobacteriaceae bacterium]MBV9502029.1 cytochrome c oxidase assembly protein [Acidobacteriaceae bacterium]